MNINKLKIKKFIVNWSLKIGYSLLILCYLFIGSVTTVLATNCASVPISGNYTVSSSCQFANTVDGVDAGTGTSNTATITINSGQTLTIAAGQTVTFGRSGNAGITINGTINIVKTGQLKQTALWMVDSDADGVPSSTTQTAQSTSPGSTYRRRNLETTLGANVSNLAADCNDSSANVYRSDVSTATDADQDGYYTGSLTTNCVGDSSTVSGRTYYKTTGGAFTWLASGSALGGSDCNDADATKYQNLTGYTDADGDGFGTTTPGTVCSGASLPAGYVSNNTDCNDGNSNVYQNVASTATDSDQDGYYTGSSGTNCVGASTAVSGRTYYKTTGGSYTWLATAGALGSADCNDADATKYQNLTGYTDSDGDGYGTGTGSSVCSGASLPAGYASNNTDCNDASANVYQNVASTATDADQDGYYTGASGTNCVGASTAVSGRTYYKATGGSYTWLATAGALGTTDCYDSNANAHSGQTSYFTVNRGDGSYDYDCNGTNDLNPAAQTNTYTTAGTYNWTAPLAVSSATVEAWGAGGGGRTSSGTGCPPTYGGGGGGGYVRASSVSVTSGNVYQVIVGASGTRGSPGTAGGDSSFNATYTGKGGGAGDANLAGVGGGNSGNGISNHTGGNGGIGDCTYGGGGGGGASDGGDGGAGGLGAGAYTGGSPGALGSGSASGGYGGNGGGASGNGGGPGNQPGGGGGAGKSFEFGGTGAAGEVVITYTSTDCSVQSCR